MNDKIVLSEHVDVRIVNEPDWIPDHDDPRSNAPGYRQKVEVFVDDVPIVTCVHIACTLAEDEFRDCQSMNELIAGHGSTEHTPVDVPIETLLQLHASSLQVWLENDYDAALLDSMIARPILDALAEIGDKKARERYLESILDRWQAGNQNSRRALSFYNLSELNELARRHEIDAEELEIYSDEEGYYISHGGSNTIYAFVFDLKRPEDNLFYEDQPSYVVVNPAVSRLIDDRGGIPAIRAVYNSIAPLDGMKLPWRHFLRSLEMPEQLHFKNSKYFGRDTAVYLKSDLVVNSVYIALTDNGWQTAGQRWLPQIEWNAKQEERDAIVKRYLPPPSEKMPVKRHVRRKRIPARRGRARPRKLDVREQCIDGIGTRQTSIEDWFGWMGFGGDS